MESVSIQSSDPRCQNHMSGWYGSPADGGFLLGKPMVFQIKLLTYWRVNQWNSHMSRRTNIFGKHQQDLWLFIGLCSSFFRICRLEDRTKKQHACPCIMQHIDSIISVLSFWLQNYQMVYTRYVQINNIRNDNRSNIPKQVKKNTIRISPPCFQPVSEICSSVGISISLAGMDNDASGGMFDSLESPMLLVISSCLPID